ncbi:hypothetical protein L916_13766 [Phytophthora nicotianae]|uniref:Uncharacterized protein n=1 Tax=Phytophthora nicotianae TaxID=4792 RepID=W2IIG4_PHYNI|nr:hypothetical protein L916_13766 [Phytophthora nicotianae]
MLEMMHSLRLEINLRLITPLAPTNWTFEWISVDDNHDMQLSPTGAALLSFMEGVDVDNSLHPTQLAQDSLVANSQNGVQSQTVIPSLNVHESPTGQTHFERREGNEVLDEREVNQRRRRVLQPCHCGEFRQL